MRQVQLWSVSSSEAGQRAQSLAEMRSTATEERLEELLVGTPELLGDGLTLIARQLATESGVPDLLGIDRDGRLVVLELKRGTLTRDAVAQVLDYASDLAQLGEEELARFVEEHSGHRGIDRINDFHDWYASAHPTGAEALDQPPRMILVGLGADDRARRIVNFLAERGVEIRLLTFHAFDFDGRLLVARQVETVAPSTAKVSSPGKSKEDNLVALMAYADNQGAKDLLLEVADLIGRQTSAYRWPGKTSFSFSLQERTSEGRPTLRSYVTVYVHGRRREALLLTLSPNAVEAASAAVAAFVESLPGARSLDSSWAPVQVEIDHRSWSDVRPQLIILLQALVDGWKRRTDAGEAEAEVTASSTQGGLQQDDFDLP